MVQFRNKPVIIDAINSDGTDESAAAFTRWVRDGGGLADLYPVGSVPQDPEHAYVVVHQDGLSATIQPGYWAYRYSTHGVLFVVTSEQFNSMWELHFSLRDLVKGDSFDATDVRKRYYGEADPGHGLGRHRGAGRSGQRKRREQSGDGHASADQLPAELETREPV